jgi:DNA-binding FadR family transcriptional regulator
MIDFRSRVPRHHQVADHLRSRIRGGEWAPGAQLPSEVDLAHEYHVGRDTVRQSLATLRAEGMIVPGTHGKRSRVAPAVEREPLWPQRGSVVIARPPTAEERTELEIPAELGVSVAEIHYRGTVRVVRGDRYELHID